jgi:hypothetical protein
MFMFRKVIFRQTLCRDCQSNCERSRSKNNLNIRSALLNAPIEADVKFVRIAVVV